ncbi:MAG: GNAT family N-acetyltransferase [Microbacterium sp.]
MAWVQQSDDLIAEAAARLVAKRSTAEGSEIPAPSTPGGEVWRREPDLDIWVIPQEERTILADLRTDGDAATTWQAIRELVQGQGWPSEVHFDAFRGDGLAHGLAKASGATRVATHMQVDVATSAPAEGVALQPMTPDDFAAYTEPEIEGYAQTLLQNGSAPTIETAREQSIAAHDALLPQGLETPGQHLWNVVADGERVGMLWVALNEQRGFIYDIEMDAAHRGHGYGTQTLRAGAAKTRDAGLATLALNVWGSNDDARRLYTREGYIETDAMWMADAG